MGNIPTSSPAKLSASDGLHTTLYFFKRLNEINVKILFKYRFHFYMLIKVSSGKCVKSFFLVALNSRKGAGSVVGRGL